MSSGRTVVVPLLNLAARTSISGWISAQEPALGRGAIPGRGDTELIAALCNFSILSPHPKPTVYSPRSRRHAVPTQGRAGGPWDGGARPVGVETRQPGLQEWYRLNRTSLKKRIVTGGHWATL